MHTAIAQHKPAIIRLCREYGVSRLEIFGSAATEAFDPNRSDVDFLVSSPSDYDFGPWLGRFQDLEASLAEAIGRPAHLVMISALKNPWFAREASKARKVIYDASTHARVAVDITALNVEIGRIVARQDELRTSIDAIVADIVADLEGVA